MMPSAVETDSSGAQNRSVRDIASETGIALGAVGRFWTPSIEWHDVSAAAFPTFADPGWGRIAVSFRSPASKL